MQAGAFKKTNVTWALMSFHGYIINLKKVSGVDVQCENEFSKENELDGRETGCVSIWGR